MLRWKLGSAFGIGIYLHASFLLLPLLVLLSTEGSGLVMIGLSMVLLAAIFGCVVLHELGHAQMARYFGIGTRDITLYPIGGVARLERMPERPWQEFFIAVAGPAVNVVLGGSLLAMIAPSFALMGGREFVHSHWGNFLLMLCLANAMMVLFNLIPAFPMDGGRVLRSLLSLALGRLRATEIAAWISLVLALLMVAGGLILWQFFPESPTLLSLVGVFVFVAGRQELAMVRHREAARNRKPLDALPALEAVPVEEPQHTSPTGFSGLAWDVSQRAWVIWHNGRPISTFGAKSE
jgi:Zn-dependent protease